MNKKTITAFILYIPLLFFPYIVKDYWEVSYLNHAFFLAFFVVIFITSKEGMRFLLSPSSITCLYLYICFFLGDILFRNEFNLMKHHYDYYIAWHHYNLASTYTNICIYLALLSYFLVNKKTPQPHSHSFSKSTITVFIILFVCSTPFASFEIPGGIQNNVMFLSTIGIIYYCSVNIKSFKRYLIYALLLFLIAIANPDDKRNSIFMIYVIVLLESRFISQISFKHILLGGIGFVFVFFLIVLMSVFRTGISSFSEAISFIPTYLTGELVIGALANNFEVDYVFINSFTPIEFIEENTGLLNYGMSYFKVLFLPFSRDLIPDKPEATMILYTKVYDSLGAKIGLCYPINMAAEAYWNFRYYGALIVPIIYYFLNYYYCKGFRFLTFRNTNCYFSSVMFLFVMYYNTPNKIHKTRILYYEYV